MSGLPKIKNDYQWRDTEGWKKLCDYIDELAESGGDEFSPREALGNELFEHIYTLPESISKLKKVKKVWLYGSNLKRIPPEIGEMESLEYFDPYTSYDLKWFPYEITKCKKLFDSRVSTRALFGNFKNRKLFPDLTNNPVRYHGDKLNCSICSKEMTYEETDQYWVTMRIGTDDLPLLANVCSEDCKSELSNQEFAAPHYLQFPHKGGKDLPKADMTYEEWGRQTGRIMTAKEFQKKMEEERQKKEEAGEKVDEKPKLLKVIWKIWEK